MRASGAERRRCRGCDSYFCETAGCASPRHYEDDGDDGISPTQPFPTHKIVRFADTINVDAPGNFDPNDENAGTAIPARSCRPAEMPRYDSHGTYIPHPDSIPFEPAERDDQHPHPDDAQRPVTPTDEADQLPLTTGPRAVFGPSPGTLIRDFAKAMDGVNHPGAPSATDDDMLTTDADVLPTLVASLPVDTASPTGSVGGVCVSMPSTDPWEKLDPWTQFTAYEQAGGWNRRDPVEPSTAPRLPPPLPHPQRRLRTPPTPSTFRSCTCSATSPRRLGPSA